MLIYQGTSEHFINDIRENTIADTMAANFRVKLGKDPAPQEFVSWQNSLSRVRDLLELGEIENSFVALEYEVPYNQSRLDCLLFGKGEGDSSNIILIELKQWTSVTALPEEGNFVETYTGGRERVVPHPSQQAKGYHYYLTGFVEEFEKTPALNLFSCAYCHNYSRSEGKGLFNPVYSELIRDFPLYTKEDTKILGARIKELLDKGPALRFSTVSCRAGYIPPKSCLKMYTGS